MSGGGQPEHPGPEPGAPFLSPAPAAQMSADELAKAAGGRIVNGKFVPNAK